MVVTAASHDLDSLPVYGEKGLAVFSCEGEGVFCLCKCVKAVAVLFHTSRNDRVNQKLFGLVNLTQALFHSS